MKQISPQEARDIIEEIKQKEINVHGRPENTWDTFHNHIFGSANIAKAIASKIDSMDPDRMYVAGLLHDCGKMQEPAERMNRYHPNIAYDMLKDRDPEIAELCLLHEFAWNSVPSFKQSMFLNIKNEEDYDIIKHFAKENKISSNNKSRGLSEDETNRLDKFLLIQLADAMSNKKGICTIENRAEEFYERNGKPMNRYVVDLKIKIKKYFDKKLGFDIYDLIKEPLTSTEILPIPSKVEKQKPTPNNINQLITSLRARR